MGVAPLHSNKLNCCCFRRITSNIDQHNHREMYTTDDIRNIGIMAHIDAGKTTLAESMLHIANKVEGLGTAGKRAVQLDYMEQEIKRGITIRAACSSFNWGQNHINIVDTPGHTDFSGEVYSAMDVIDGCIIVVDGTKGVQAQTRHINAALPPNMPKIIFINKIDRAGVDIDHNMRSIKKYLRLNTVLLNAPKKHSGTSATTSTVSILKSGQDSHPESKLLIEALTDSLADIDDHLVERYLDQGSVTTEMLIQTLRKYVQNTTVVPVLCGSAVTLTGVDHLLSFVCELFPKPSKDRKFPSTGIDNTLAYTFKTVCGDHAQISAFCKIIRGTMMPNLRLYNLSLGKGERAGKIYKIHGGMYEERTQLIEGDIGMIEGMAEVRTGHVLSQDPKETLPKDFRMSSDVDVAAKCVCFATFTAKDEMATTTLVETMAKLKIEDPSLYYKYDPDTVDGLVVGGYGEFHLEILAEILKDNYGIPVQIGKVRVAIKETPLEAVEASMFIDSTNPEDKSHIGLQLIMEPMGLEHANTPLSSLELMSADGGNSLSCQVETGSIVFMRTNGSVIENPEMYLGASKTQDIILNIKQLLHNAMAAGPLIGGSMISTRIRITKLKLLPQSTIAGAKAIASKVLKSIYDKVPIELQQPMVSLNIVLPSEYVGCVIPDLRNNRKADILNVTSDNAGDTCLTTIVATAPMKEFLGYTKTLRALTNGNATFTMVRCGYAPIHINEVK